MAKVSFNQKGYIGASMSVRASQAYEDGEMPKSKWTKKAMITSLREWCDENDRTFDEAVTKMRKDDIFNQLFTYSSWHHTSKFCTATNFYSIDENAAAARFQPMTSEELAVRDAAKEAEHQARMAAYEAAERARKEQEEAKAKYYAEHGYSEDSVLAYEDKYPERCVRRISKSSKREIIEWTTPRGTVRSCPLEHAAYRNYF